MRVVKIEWQNYRRLRDSVLEVREHLVLVGPNDSGKSSILRLLHLCLGTTQSQLNQTIGLRDFTDPSRELVLSVTLEGLDGLKAAFPDEITIGEPNTLLIRVEASLDPSDPESQVVRRYFPDSGHDRAPSRHQLDSIGFRYVSAARSLSRELGGSPGSVVRQLLSEIDLADDLSAIKDSIASVQVALDEAASLQVFRGEFARVLSEALPRTVGQADVRLLSESDRTDDPMSGVTVTVNDSGHDAPLSEQSDGIRAMSALALMGLSFSGAEVIAIDEPEVHLHPVAQRSMAHQLQKLQGQRIIATHSPSVVGAFLPSSIAVMRADRSIHQLPLDAEFNQEEMAARHWANRMIEPLTAHQIVLVEGPSDRILFERVAELFGMQLDRIGVAVFELDGAGLFAKAYRLYGPDGFNIPITGLVDEAERDDWAKAIGIPGSDLESAGFAVCSPDLEGEYINALGHTFVRDVLVKHNMRSTMLRSCAVQSLDDISVEQLEAFCRHKKRKVLVALALAQNLELAGAEKLNPLLKLLEAVAP